MGYIHMCMYSTLIYLFTLRMVCSLFIIKYKTPQVSCECQKEIDIMIIGSILHTEIYVLLHGLCVLFKFCHTFYNCVPQTRRLQSLNSSFYWYYIYTYISIPTANIFIQRIPNAYTINLNIQTLHLFVLLWYLPLSSLSVSQSQKACFKVETTKTWNLIFCTLFKILEINTRP